MKSVARSLLGGSRQNTQALRTLFDMVRVVQFAPRIGGRSGEVLNPAFGPRSSDSDVVMYDSFTFVRL